MSMHNPDKLTDEQIGVADGWRLLDVDEVEARRVFPVVDCWQAPGLGWSSGYYGTDRHSTYRTRLTRAELRKARGLGPEQPPSNPAEPAASQLVCPQCGSVRVYKAPRTFLSSMECHECGHGFTPQPADECRHQYTTFTGRCDLCGLTLGDQFDKSHRKQPAEAVSEAARESALTEDEIAAVRDEIVWGFSSQPPLKRKLLQSAFDKLRAITDATAAQQAEIAALREERDSARWDKEQLWLAIMFGAHGENTQPKEVADAEKVLQATRERLAKCEGARREIASMPEQSIWWDDRDDASAERVSIAEKALAAQPLDGGAKP